MCSSLEEVRFEKSSIFHHATSAKQVIDGTCRSEFCVTKTHDQNQEVLACTDINTPVRYDDFHPRHVALWQSNFLIWKEWSNTSFPLPETATIQNYLTHHFRSLLFSRDEVAFVVVGLPAHVTLVLLQRCQSRQSHWT